MSQILFLRRKDNQRYWAGGQHFAVDVPALWVDNITVATRIQTDHRANSLAFVMSQNGIEVEKEAKEWAEVPSVPRKKLSDVVGPQRSAYIHSRVKNFKRGRVGRPKKVKPQEEDAS